MNRSAQKWKRSMTILFRDLDLFASVYWAHFIVWRALRRSRRQDAWRSKQFKLLRGGKCAETLDRRDGRTIGLRSL